MLAQTHAFASKPRIVSHVEVEPSCSFLTLLALPPLAPWRVVADGRHSFSSLVRRSSSLRFVHPRLLAIGCSNTDELLVIAPINSNTESF